MLYFHVLTEMHKLNVGKLQPTNHERGFVDQKFFRNVSQYTSGA